MGTLEQPAGSSGGAAAAGVPGACGRALPPGVLFDLDGTLVDHFGGIHAALVAAGREAGRPEPTLAEVRRVVGGGIRRTIVLLFGEAHAEAVHAIYPRHLAAHLTDGLVPLPGAEAILRGLARRGVPVGIVTNKDGGAARAICAHLGWSPLVRAVVGDGDTPWRKPDPRMVEEALARAGVAHRVEAPAVLVGDSPWDLEAARAAGLDAVLVATGTHTAAELRAAGAPVVYGGLGEIGWD